MNNLTTISSKLGSILFLVIAIVVCLVAIPYITWGIGTPLLILGLFLIFISIRIQTSRIATVIAAASVLFTLVLFSGLSYVENVLSQYNSGQHNVGLFVYTALTILFIEFILLLLSLKRTDFKNKDGKLLTIFQTILFVILFTLSIYAFYHEFIYPSVRNYTDVKECISAGYKPQIGVYNDKCSEWFGRKVEAMRFTD